MVKVAQTDRASDCGSGGRGFESRLSPFFMGEGDRRISDSRFEISDWIVGVIPGAGPGAGIFMELRLGWVLVIIILAAGRWLG